jgi:hypothetical protein
MIIDTNYDNEFYVEKKAFNITKDRISVKMANFIYKHKNSIQMLGKLTNY